MVDALDKERAQNRGAVKLREGFVDINKGHRHQPPVTRLPAENQWSLEQGKLSNIHPICVKFSRDS